MKTPSQEIADRTVLVTGGASGIGAVYTRAFCALGATVVIADVDREKDEALAEELTDQGGRVGFVVMDVADEDSVKTAGAVVGTRFGGVDVLINNAALYVALGPKTPFDEITTRDFDRVMAVNVRGAWQCAKAFAPSMRENGWGRIVNITSSVAFSGTPGFAHYVASKAAIVGLTRTLARELGPDGITVNAVAPGLVDNASSQALNSESYIDQAIFGRAVPRAMAANDLVGSVLFLASNESEFITGQVLVVDGGALMR